MVLEQKETIEMPNGAVLQDVIMKSEKVTLEQENRVLSIVFGYYSNQEMMQNKKPLETPFRNLKINQTEYEAEHNKSWADFVNGFSLDVVNGYQTTEENENTIVSYLNKFPLIGRESYKEVEISEEVDVLDEKTGEPKKDKKGKPIKQIVKRKERESVKFGDKFKLKK